MRTIRMSLLGLAAVALVIFPTGGAGASNDPSFKDQWGLAKIGAESAWTRTTGAGIRIGIVDTGIDLEHEDLAGEVVESINCVGSVGDQGKCYGSAPDDQGHGQYGCAIAAAS